MARTSQQIFRELSTFFNPAAKLLQQERGLIGPDTERRVREAERQRDAGIKNITRRANRRGVVFGGLPIKEEAELLGRFEDEAGRIRSEGARQSIGLGRELANLRLQQGTLAQQLFQSELDRREAARAAAAQRGDFSNLSNLLQGILGEQKRGGGLSGEDARYLEFLKNNLFTGQGLDTGALRTAGGSGQIPRNITINRNAGVNRRSLGSSGLRFLP